MNNKTKDLKTVAFAAAGMFLAYWIYSIFIENYLPVNVDIKTLIGKAILFIFGVGSFFSQQKISKITSIQRIKRRQKQF